MQFKVLQEDFSKCLNTALRFTSTKIQLPVLANILLKTEKGKLIIKATNLETSISLSIGAKVEKEGEITVPAKVMAEIVSNLGMGQIDFEVDHEKLKIVTSRFKSVVTGMNSSDFPKVADKIPSEALEISSLVLSDALSDTLFSVSGDESRPVLTGVLMLLNKEEVVFVGTDGFRLSQKKIDFKGVNEVEHLILPKNAISEVVRLSAGVDTVGFFYNKTDNLAIFAFANTVLTTRIIEGEFPDFEKIIPKTSKITIRIDKEEMVQAVKLASVFAKDAANVIKMKVLKDSVIILAESSKSGVQEMKIDAKVEGEAGDESIIAFNYRFLEEFLNTVKNEEIVIKFSDPNSPVIFLDPSDKDFLHIIMPVRLQN